MNTKKIQDTLSQSRFLISKILHIKNGKKYIALKLVIWIYGLFLNTIHIIIPGLLINELTGSVQSRIYHIHILGLYLTLYLLLPFACSFIMIPLETFIWKLGEELNIKLTNEFNVAISKMDYQQLEIPEVQEWKERVDGTVQSSLELVDMLGNILKSILSLFIAFSIVSYLNPLLVALIVVTMFINSQITKWGNFKKFELRKEFSKRQRKIWSVACMLEDFSFAKEIRLYQVSDMLLDKLNDAKRKLTMVTLQNIQNRNKVSLVLKLTEFIQTSVVYIYMIYKVLIHALPIGSMTICLSASNQFSTAISTVINSYLALDVRTMEIKEWREFLEIPIKKKDGKLIPHINSESCFEFRNVSFKYPGSDSLAIQSLNLKVYCDEKLCVVGINGSGKTTFIKLLLRLYEPTSGEILLNGINVDNYDYEMYKKLFAPVFQDFALFELTLRENIVLSEGCDEDKFREVCNNANISSLIDKLTKGPETQIGKETESDGIEPSGGEGQRIAVARACYHGGDVFILDEPTAALDPNAEHEIYTQFDEMITDKCAILITHRLSAVQLADKVAVFDDGQVAEYGTHAELYAKGGIYTEMFDKQAQFYRNEAPATENAQEQ